jgi:predicted DNA-binding protein (MmcQ/YjbR family)
LNIEEIRNYCIKKNGTTESFPFDNTTLVFKVGGKIYALLDLEKRNGMNLKSEPEYSILLREKYEFIVPGYHMNKKHWNSVYIDGSIPSTTIKEWITNSYALIFNSLPKSMQVELTND